MRDRLILLPGWGLGVSPLEPLAAALQGLDEHLRVEIEPLPELESSDLNEWLDELDASVPDNAWLGGWSLGGMLASELAARRGERCCGLLTLASNPCFVAHAEWASAMPGRPLTGFWPAVTPTRVPPSSASACCAPRAPKIHAVCRACCLAARRIPRARC